MIAKKNILHLGRSLLILCSVILTLSGMAQNHHNSRFRVKGNMMYITLSRHLTVPELDEFTNNYNLSGIGLHQLVQTGRGDSIKAMGWTIDLSQPDLYSIQKPLQSYADLHGNTGSKIIFTPIPTPDDWRVVGGNKVIFGYNTFKTGNGFTISGDTVYFFLKGFGDANKVRLAGSFTNWQHAAFPMTKNDSGWTVAVRLKPGAYYYKFIIEDDDWTTDPNNEITENDGQGNENSLFYVPNKIFFLKGYENAANVFLAGSFNNWVKNKLHLQRTKGGWKLSMYLEPGTYKYNYYVDGITIAGDDDKNQSNELSLGERYTFRLKGFTNARKVVLAGDFNNWETEGIYMKKTADGWEVPYALGPGNYQYKFIVDDDWMTDPANPQKVNDGRGNVNSYLVIGANYTFHLKGHRDARSVNITGDFIDWSPDGLPMKRMGDEWVCSVRLAKGKHLYKFLLDGEAIRDPGNKDWESDTDSGEKSVIWVD